MSIINARLAILLSLLGGLYALPAGAQIPFSFSAGGPDGAMATATRPDAGGEIESADDFILGSTTSITSATFTGLLPIGAPLSDIGEVVAEIYRVFPKDSNDPPSGNVPTRVNSPSDVAFSSRDSASGGLSFGADVVSASFTANNSVQPGGIHPLPGVLTGGDGPVRGEEVTLSVSFSTPIMLPADHYFFVPQVELESGVFLWLSASKPISDDTGPFAPDLQSWTRDEALDPDWLRVGTDIVGAGAFNASFALAGSTIPEPSTWAMMLIGLAGLGYAGWRHTRKVRFAAG